MFWIFYFLFCGLFLLMMWPMFSDYVINRFKTFKQSRANKKLVDSAVKLAIRKAKIIEAKRKYKPGDKE